MDKVYKCGQFVVNVDRKVLFFFSKAGTWQRENAHIKIDCDPRDFGKEIELDKFLAKHFGDLL